jgi:hypothetical protein
MDLPFRGHFPQSDAAEQGPAAEAPLGFAGQKHREFAPDQGAKGRFR